MLRWCVLGLGPVFALVVATTLAVDVQPEQCSYSYRAVINRRAVPIISRPSCAAAIREVVTIRGEVPIQGDRVHTLVDT